MPLLRDPLGFIESLSGIGGLVEIRLGLRRVYVVTAPGLVHELLVTLARDAPRGAVQQTLRDAFGDGLLMSEGQAHRDRRRCMTPAFTKARVADYMPVVQQVVRERSCHWGDGAVVDIAKEMNHLALDVVTRTLFGARLEDDLAEAFHRALPDLVKGQIFHSLYPHPSFARLPLSVNRRFDEAVRVINQVVDRAVGEPAAGARGEDTLLSLLRAAVDPATGEPLTEDDVRSEAITMFGAGTETVSTTMTWLLHELVAHPDVYERVVTELDAYFGDVSGAGEDVITPETFDHLPYTSNVLRELLRLHAPNAFLMRTASRDLTLGGHLVPEGTELLFSLTALHRHPEFFPDPHTFDPGRWDTATDTGTGTVTGTDTDTGTSTSADTGADAGTDIEAPSDTGTDTETDTDTDTDTDDKTDIGTDTDPEGAAASDGASDGASDEPSDSSSDSSSGTASGSAARRAMMPFGAGKHKCVGEDLACAELGIAAVTLLRTLRPVPEPGAGAKEVVWTTVQAQGLALRFARRTDSGEVTT